MTKTTFASRVMAFLKGGDEAKLTGFSAKLEKYYAKQIEMREEKIEDLKEKIQDAEQSLQDEVVNVDISRIATGEDQKSYCPSFVEKVNKALQIVEGFETEVEVLEAEIQMLEKSKTAVFG